MNTFLKVIKDRGQAIIVQGPQGSGKTLLAKCLAEGVQTSCTTIENVLGACSGFTGWLGSHPAVVIVEGFVDVSNGVAELSALIASPQLRCKLLGKKSIWVDTPLFIFCTQEPVELPRDCRRFYTILINCEVLKC